MASRICDIRVKSQFNIVLKRFNNKLKLTTQTNKLHASRSASHRSRVPETRGGVTIADGGGGHCHTQVSLRCSSLNELKNSFDSSSRRLLRALSTVASAGGQPS